MGVLKAQPLYAYRPKIDLEQENERDDAVKFRWRFVKEKEP